MSQQSIILISSKTMVIKCQKKEFNNIFKELFKLIPKETKLKDLKRILINKMSMGFIGE